MGKCVVGSVLVVGSKRDMGIDNDDDICHSSTSFLALRKMYGKEIPSLHSVCFPDSTDDMVWSELFPLWNALIRINILNSSLVMFLGGF